MFTVSLTIMVFISMNIALSVGSLYLDRLLDNTKHGCRSQN